MLPFKCEPHKDCLYIVITEFAPLTKLGESRSTWKSYLAFMKLLEESGYEGWCGGVDKNNLRLRAFLSKIGCIEYAEEGDRVFVRRLARKPYGRLRVKDAKMAKVRV